MTLRCWVESIGVRGPGLSGWPSTQAVLAGTRPFDRQRTQIPEPVLLSASERRRAGRVLRLAVGVASEAAGDAASRLPTVFTSAGGDGDNCHELCTALAGTQRAVSPTRFMNSVHNAAAGYWSLAAKSMRASTTVSAHDDSFAAGLLECATQLASVTGEVLLVAYDIDYPAPLKAVRPIPDAFGCALRLTALRTRDSLAALDLGFGEDPPTRLQDPALEDIRASIPAARVLPLLVSLARREAARCTFGTPGEWRLQVDVTPC